MAVHQIRLTSAKRDALTADRGDTPLPKRQESQHHDALLS